MPGLRKSTRASFAPGHHLFWMTLFHVIKSHGECFLVFFTGFGKLLLWPLQYKAQPTQILSNCMGMNRFPKYFFYVSSHTITTPTTGFYPTLAWRLLYDLIQYLKLLFGQVWLLRTFELWYQTLYSFLIKIMYPLYGLTSSVDLLGNTLYRFTRSNKCQCQISFSQTLIS